MVEIQVHIGDRVDTTNGLMTVADPSKIMVVANIYDTDIGHVQKGKTVTFSTDIFPNISFKGLIKYISDTSDPDTKTIKTYIRNRKGSEPVSPEYVFKDKDYQCEKETSRSAQDRPFV